MKTKLQFDFFALLLVFAAAPLWAYLITVIPQGTGFGDTDAGFLTVIALVGISFAIWWIIKKRSYAVSLAILISPLLVAVALRTAAMLI